MCITNAQTVTRNVFLLRITKPVLYCFIWPISLLLASSALAEQNDEYNFDLKLAKEKNCLVCHGIKTKLVSPSFAQIRDKYKNNPPPELFLEKKILYGGSGVWGNLPMPSNSEVSEDEARILVAWIISENFPNSKSYGNSVKEIIKSDNTSSEFIHRVYSLQQKVKDKILEELSREKNKNNKDGLRNILETLNNIFEKNTDQKFNEYYIELIELSEKRGPSNASRKILAELNRSWKDAFRLEKYDVFKIISEIELAVWEMSFSRTHDFGYFSSDLAQAYEYLGEYDLAFEYYSRVIELFKKIDIYKVEFRHRELAIK